MQKVYCNAIRESFALNQYVGPVNSTPTGRKAFSATRKVSHQPGGEKKYYELKIIRQALLNEQEGYDFYTLAAQQAENPEAKEAFTNLAAEELNHINWLLGNV